MTLNSSDEAEEEEMLKRAIAMSLEQEEEEEELSSIKGEQKIKEQKRWIVKNVHKLSTFQLTQRRRCPQLGMRRRMVRQRWGGRAQLLPTR